MEPQKTKNIVLSCAVILIVACLCLGLIVVSGVGVSWVWPFTPQHETSDNTPSQITEVPAEASQTDSNELPEELASTIATIESEVMQIRGLSTTEPVDRTLISIDELETIVVNDFFSEYTDSDAQQDVLILSLLGLLPNDFDLKEFYNKLYSEQISGFYDDETKEIFVVQGMTFGGSEKLTYAHEFTHVLQDQVFDFDQGLGFNEDACEADSERCAAVQALIEGDASQTEILWFQTYATRDDYDDLMDTYDNFESPVLDAAPPYMAADLYFPYEKGLAFVDSLYKQGGFEAVDEAFANVPASTEQILHPDRYPLDTPDLVVLPNLIEVLGNDWVLIDQNVMGEWYTFLILNKAYEETHRLSEEQASSAAEGWGGDAYAYYLNERTNEIVFVMDTLWDSPVDAQEFTDAFIRYADSRWDNADTQIFDHPTWSSVNLTIVQMLNGERTLWVMGPNNSVVEAVLQDLQ